MKFLAIFVLICGLVIADPILRNTAENERLLRQIIENSRRNFPCGWPSSGIGPLDPMFIPTMTITQRANGVNIISDLRNVNFIGLRHFITERLTINTDNTINYVFFTDYTTMNSDHSTRGSMIGIPVLNGQGRMFSEMFNSRYTGTIRYAVRAGSNQIYMTGMTTRVDIQHMTMEMSGFGVLNSTVNQQISDQLPYMITSSEFQQTMNDLLTSIIEPVFGAVVEGATPFTIADRLRFLANNPTINC